MNSCLLARRKFEQNAKRTRPTECVSEETVSNEPASVSSIESEATGKITLIMIGLCLAVFLTGMRRFHALGNISWWSAICLFTLSLFQLFYGKLYSLFSIKIVYVATIALFEIGSLICATSPNSAALITGRAIAGLGAADFHRQHHGYNEEIFGVAAIVGPFIGGTITEQTTWRWCFGINLPLGAVTIVICISLIRTPIDAQAQTKSFEEKLRQFDILGTVILIRSLEPVSLVGSKLCHVHYRRCVQRHSLCANLVSAIQGRSTLGSAVILAPIIGGYVVCSVIAGIMTSLVGYYNPAMIVGTVVAAIGAGLLTTVTPSTTTASRVGYGILYGSSVGFGFGQPSYVVQTVPKQNDVSIGVTLITLVQNLSATISVTVGQTIFQNTLTARLETVAPDVDMPLIGSGGATKLISQFPASDRSSVLGAYSTTLVRTLYISLGLSCVSVIGASLTRWKSIERAGC
ncbi:efflux pump antibiotic resistance protein, putative [Talaromyces stipitatus ATCC 10500]|uniref:Efflux pump antibiotic resistance protein, putative n=1 Tax=Talaromyces stipitatus (strain ATCC 10500 / CBS 375.48 / QM 6759 / NRRL 1006) TaxID=441959 RepID=B8M1W3_TALSN|nr:efflux pump antibiotic resistance protein, putative [Talaromyces stipitatus ATCC 10500]EED21341.1 efflux pump antibiotic resistance protein, putative [Talaromyces stipitatus ATCC 10500]